MNSPEDQPGTQVDGISEDEQIDKNQASDRKQPGTSGIIAIRFE